LLALTVHHWLELKIQEEDTTPETEECGDHIVKAMNDQLCGRYSGFSKRR
jgi:hypothetical protein